MRTGTNRALRLGYALVRNLIHDAVRLLAGDAYVEIAPDVGGSIAAFRWRGHDVLRPTARGARNTGNVRQFACYPLIPYSNRIANATLRLRDGTTHDLARNFGDHPHAIHGVGWQRAWLVEIAEPAHASLSLQHSGEHEGAAAWPFSFRATQAFALTSQALAATLTMTLTIENVDSRAFPFGLGWHPFFPRHRSTLLGFRAAGVWETDATRLPTRHVRIPNRWRFDPPRALDDATFDHVFTGWDGHASLTQPDHGYRVTLEADPSCDHLVVFVPTDRDDLAVEPVTHMTDAFNRHARGDEWTGTRLLRPEQAYSCTMRIVVSPHAPPESS